MQGKYKTKIKKHSKEGKISEKDIYGNPITAKIENNSKANRSYYNDRLNTMVLGSDYDSSPKEIQERIKTHENYHAKQYNTGSSNFDIAHNTDNAVASRLRKKPSVTATDENYYDYHNRKPIESKLDIQNFRKNNKNSEFIPDDVVFDKKIDISQYDNPYSFEGEADYYENTGKEFPKYSKGSKAMKKCSKGIKIKKYNEGTDSVLGQMGGTVGGLGAMGIEALTKSKYDPKYTSQLKDENQAIGRAIGAGAGQALNLVVPGLGSLASPILSSVGGAVQREFQAKKLANLKNTAEFNDRVTKANENTIVDPTSFQAKQYSKGSKKLKAPSATVVSESTNTSSMPKTKIPTKSQEQQAQFNKFVQRNGTIKPAESDGIKTARKVLRGADAAASIGQLGNFSPVPQINAIGKLSSAVGIGTGLANAALDAYSGDYKSAGMNVIGAGLSGVVGKLGGKTVSKVGGQLTGLDGIAEGAKRVKYTNLAKNPHIGAANAAELYMNKPEEYSKGTKVIEIEGKKSPEIHTDKNFNLKNLGTIPHSKGGNKVLAEEGDVVFPTQNSPKKYNEIMNAIMNKDKYKLKKEQSKLPEDKVSKYDGGGTVYSTKDALKDLDSSTRNISRGFKGAMYKGLSNPWMPYSALYSGNNPYNNSSTSTNNEATADDLGKKPNLTPNREIGVNVAPGINVKTKQVGGSGKSAKGSKGKSKSTSTWKNPNQTMSTLETGRMTKSDNSVSIPERIELAREEVKSGGVTPKEDKKGIKTPDLNSLAELAPIAYNLGQGLFGKAEKVNRKEYNPQLEQYVDTSNNMRREVNQAYRGALSNARNLSGGLASNVRANSQAASNLKLSQMNQIDSQEYGKQVDVNNRNVDRINDGKKINIDLFNNYEDLDAQNRAVKQNALSQGLSELADLGYRNKSDKNRLAAWNNGRQLLSEGTAYGTSDDGSGTNVSTYFNQGMGFPTNPSLNVGVQVDPSKKARKHSKGSKSIQVTRKYKLK